VSQTALKSQFIDPFKLERVKNPGLKNGSANNNSTEVVENGSDSTTEAKKIHDQTPETVFGTGAAIRLNGSDQVVNFFSMHLEYRR
jgi:hypothetical protein